MADMKQIFTYPSNSGTDWIDPTYVGNATSGLTQRVDELLAGTYKGWSNLDPVSDLGTTTSEAMQNLSKFINYEGANQSGVNITFYDFWTQPIVIATRDVVAYDAPITSANTLNPATITTTAPHEFLDGMLIEIENFDGTWGTFYNGSEFYCKKISSTELQAATDPALTNLIGFVPVTTLSYIGGASENALKYSIGLNDPIRLDFTNLTMSPTSGSYITFNSITHQGSALVGNTYYLKGVSGSSVFFDLYTDQALTIPMTLADIVPMVDQDAVTIPDTGLPGDTNLIEVTSGYLSAWNYNVYVNTPKAWADGVERWNSNQIYYLDNGPSAYKKEVYLDAARTQRVILNPAPWNPTAIEPSGVTNIYGLLQPSKSNSTGVSIEIEDTHDIRDSDPLTFDTIPTAEQLNGGASISGNTYYLKTSAETAIQPNFNVYDLYEDAGLTNQLTIADLTTGTHTVDINLASWHDPIIPLGYGYLPYAPQFMTSYPHTSATADDYWVGELCTTTIAAEANPDFNIAIGDVLTWTATGIDQATIPSIHTSNTLSVPDPGVVPPANGLPGPVIAPVSQAFDDWIDFVDVNSVTVWVDITNHPRLYDSAGQPNNMNWGCEVDSLTVSGNGYDVVVNPTNIGGYYYFLRTVNVYGNYALCEIWSLTPDVNYAFNELTFDPLPANNTYRKTGTPQPTNPGTIVFSQELTTAERRMQLSLTSSTQLSFVSGNTVPSSMWMNEYNYLTRTADPSKFEYLIERLDPLTHPTVRGTYDWVTSETFNDIDLIPQTIGDYTLTRKPWTEDKMLHKPWIFGDVYASTNQPNRPLLGTMYMSDLYTGAGNITVGSQSYIDSTTGTVSLSANEPNPYTIRNQEIVLPGNEVYSYQNAVNTTIYAADVDYTKWWEPGETTQALLTDYPGQISSDVTVTVNGSGYLQTVVPPTFQLGRYAENSDMLLELKSPASTYVPPTPTPAELEDVWDTEDQWASDGSTTPNKEWPDHVTPMSAEINYSSPTIANLSQSGIKYTRSAGHTKWVLDVVYPPMTASDFKIFHAIAQAAHGQSTPFYFNLNAKDGGKILWKDFYDQSNTTVSPRFKDAIVSGDTLALFEGFSSNEPNAFMQGEVFIDGENENGNLHTALSGTDSNIFGEAKIRTPWPFRQAQSAGSKAYKNPYHAVVTLADDNFTWSVDVNNYYYVSVSFDLDSWK